MPVHPPNQLQLFEDRIADHIEQIRKTKVCQWCRNDRLPIAARGLCSSCYAWERAQRRLSQEVANLPPKTLRDPHFLLRHELDVANCAVELCKIDGSVRDHHLERTDPIDLEAQFDSLSERTLGARRGSNLFHGHTFYFYDFSPMQRVWLWHLIDMMVSEMNRRDRRHRAYNRSLRKTNSSDPAP
jgi:hypothetical protein